MGAWRCFFPSLLLSGNAIVSKQLLAWNFFIKLCGSLVAPRVMLLTC